MSRAKRMPGMALACAALLLIASGCSMLSDQEETALSVYKQNSKAYYNNGKYLETIDQCRRGLKLDDGDFSLNLTLAFALMRAGGKANLFAAYEQFLETEDLLWFEDDYRISLGLGETCFKISTYYQERLDYFDRRIAEDPELAEVFKEEIESCRAGKEAKLAEAIAHLEGTLRFERQRENLDAILTLGQAHAYSGHFDTAISLLQKGLGLLETSTSFQQRRIEQENSTTADGRRFFERQIARNLLLEKELRGILAFVYQRTGDLDSALEQYDLLEKRDLFDDIQYYNRGITYQALERYQEAIADLEQYLAMASVAGKDFDEDEHFHIAFERIEACRKAAGGTNP